MFKKLALALALVAVLATPALSAVAFTPSVFYGNDQTNTVIIKIHCVGTSDGATTDQKLINDYTYPEISKLINERWLISATTVPSAVTAPDAADLVVYQRLGGSTVSVNMFATNGVNAVHATATYTVYPDYTSGSPTNGYWPITGPIVIDLENQASAGGICDIYLLFVK